MSVLFLWTLLHGLDVCLKSHVISFSKANLLEAHQSSEEYSLRQHCVVEMSYLYFLLVNHF